MANAADGVELGLDVVDANINLAAIRLELGLPRAASSDAAAKLRHSAPAPGEAGQLVFELCEFNLKLAFAGFGVTSEDVEDQLRSVDDVQGMVNPVRPRILFPRSLRRRWSI
jgi:hypothetical protein